jgi:TetR/AcrR family transcriptional regulator, repressor for neighboring sulfatase
MPKKSVEMAAPVRVRRSPEQSRTLILEAAIRVISQHGPQGVGLKEVGAEAGVSHGLVAHYFGTFDGLVEASVLECAARLRKRLIERFQETPDVTPDTMMQVYLDAVLEPWYGRLVSWALLSDHEGSKSHAAKLAPELKLIADASHQVMQRRIPSMTRAESEALMVALWSMAIGYVAGNGFFWRALGRTPGPKRDKELRSAASSMCKALFRD